MKNMNGLTMYINLVFGMSLTGIGWLVDLMPALKALSILVGIIMMIISGWQIYQKGRLQKRQRIEIENKDKNKEDNK